MGYPEQPVCRNMEYVKIRRYKCRKCGQFFKDYYWPEAKRVCAKCAKAKGQS
jgi:hypothetical protein